MFQELGVGIPILPVVHRPLDRGLPLHPGCPGRQRIRLLHYQVGTPVIKHMHIPST
jgi:hypothetical protein